MFSPRRMGTQGGSDHSRWDGESSGDHESAGAGQSWSMIKLTPSGVGCAMVVLSGFAFWAVVVVVIVVIIKHCGLRWQRWFAAEADGWRRRGNAEQCCLCGAERRR